MYETKTKGGDICTFIGTNIGYSDSAPFVSMNTNYWQRLNEKQQVDLATQPSQLINKNNNGDD